MAICVTYLRFYAALKAQGVDRDQMPFKSPFQPYLAWSTLVYFSVLTFFNGFYSFMPWNVETFITTYIGIPIFLTLFTFWKLFKKTKFVKPSEADLWTGKAAIDAEVWPDTVPRNLPEKVSPSSRGTINTDLIHLCLTYFIRYGRGLRSNDEGHWTINQRSVSLLGIVVRFQRQRYDYAC